MKFNIDPIPKRVFRGIYEIMGYVRELLGEDDLTKIPDVVFLKAVSIEAKDRGYYFQACTGDDALVSLQVQEKSNSIVQGILHCGSLTKSVEGAYSLDMNIDLFRDVRRVEEFVDVVNDARQTVVVAYLENRGLRISILI